jgi:GTP-binding protein
LYRPNEFNATIRHRFFIVNISSAIFDCSAPDLDSCPDETLPEFAFIGRSNVGKSSLLNMLSGKVELARTSPTPGFTKLINIFTINKTWRLVDLPGYGYAHLARKDKSQFNRAVNDYLQHRTNLCLVFALIDSGIAPQKMDLDFVQWLAHKAIPFVLVFTKTDKESPAIVQANIAAFTERIAAWFEQLPAIFTCSAAVKSGRRELLDVIDETMKAIQVEAESAMPDAEDSPAPNREPSARELRKSRPDRDRPW